MGDGMDLRYLATQLQDGLDVNARGREKRIEHGDAIELCALDRELARIHHLGDGTAHERKAI